MERCDDMFAVCVALACLCIRVCACVEYNMSHASQRDVRDCPDPRRDHINPSLRLTPWGVGHGGGDGSDEGVGLPGFRPGLSGNDRCDLDTVLYSTDRAGQGSSDTGLATVA